MSAHPLAFCRLNEPYSPEAQPCWQASVFGDRRRMPKESQNCFLWRRGRTIFCPCLGFWELHSPGRAATYLLRWLRLCFSSWDFALISNKHLLLCEEMGFTQSWGNHNFRRAYLLLPLPCILYEGSNFVHEIISRAGKLQKCLNCYVTMKPYHTTVFCFACLVCWVFQVYVPLPWDKRQRSKVAAQLHAPSCPQCLWSTAPSPICAAMCSHNSS